MTSSSLLFLAILVFASAAPTAEQLKAFEEWFRKENPNAFSKIRVGESLDSQGKPGIFATSDIEVNETLLELIGDKIITPKNIELTDVGEVLYYIYTRWTDDSTAYDPAPYEAIAVFLVYERFFNPNSYWKPWFDILPQPSEMNNVLFWKYSELKELQGSPLYKRAQDRRAEVKERFEFHLTTIFRPFTRLFPEEPTEEQYKWALSIVRSRNALITNEEDVRQPAVVPMFDLFRHVPLTDEMSLDVWQWNQTEEKFYVRANSTFKAGDEIFVSLGEKCNSELLDYYGFVIQDNINDCVHLDMELPKTDPLFTEKTLLYRTLQPDASKFKMLKNGITMDLLRALRVLSMPPDLPVSDFILGGIPDESLGITSDFSIAQYIVNACRKLYKGYETTPEEEQKLLESPDTPLRIRLATMVKQGERLVERNIGSYYFQLAEKLAEQIKSSTVQQHEEDKDEL
jgi:hypothetical protein